MFVNLYYVYNFYWLAIFYYKTNFHLVLNFNIVKPIYSFLTSLLTTFIVVIGQPALSQQKVSATCGTPPRSEEFKATQKYIGNNRYLIEVMAKNGLFLPKDYFNSLDSKGLYKGRRLPLSDIKRKPTSEGSSVNFGGRVGLPTSTIYVPVKVWVYRTAQTDFTITQTDLVAEFGRMQEIFRSNGLPIEFYMKCPVEWLISESFYNIAGNTELTAMFFTNHDGNAINVHIVNDAPNAGTANASVNSLYISNTRNTNTTLAHEIGHIFGLDHTHRGELCNGDNDDCNNCLQEPVSRTMTQPFLCGAINNPKKCEVNGDDLCDTPADPNLNGHVDMVGGEWVYDFSSPSDNWGVPWQPDLFNLMSYSERDIRLELSYGQIGVMLSNIPGYASTSNTYSISGPTNICEGQAHTFTAGSVSGATSYQWQVPAGWGLIGDGNQSVTITPSNIYGETTIYVTAMLCGTKPAQKKLTFLPTSFTISGYSEIPIGQSSTFGTLVYSASNYNWTIPPTWTLESGQGTALIYVEPQSNAQDGWVNVSATVCGKTIWGTKFVTIGDGGGGPIEITVGSIEDTEDNAENLSFYPNPANDVIILALPSNDLSISDVRIINASSGKIVEHYGQLTNTEQIDICKLKTGEYILLYYYKNDPKSFKFIKK